MKRISRCSVPRIGSVALVIQERVRCLPERRTQHERRDSFIKRPLPSPPSLPSAMAELFSDGLDPETRSSPNPDQITDAHRLLASYPFASATPSAHGNSHFERGLRSLAKHAPFLNSKSLDIFPACRLPCRSLRSRSLISFQATSIMLATILDMRTRIT